MTRNIKGKCYDTETANWVAGYCNEYDTRDLYYCDEAVFKTESGDYFLHGVGGAFTDYAKSCGRDMVTAGEKIIPMTYIEAQKWCYEHLSYEGFITVYGPIGVA
jgi:hypothetical protein